MNITNHRINMNIEYRHSASKTNSFIDSPPYWIINNLYDFSSEANARMKMGSTAEAAAEHALQNQITDEEVIIDIAKTKYLELKGDESDDECLWSGIIANQFVKELPQFGKIVSYQNEKQIPGEKYGLKYDVIGKTDFEFDDVIIDTKATAYIKGHLETIIQAMSIIEHILDIAKNKEDIVKMYPLVMDNFRWGKGDNDPIKVFARKVWQDTWK